MPLESLYRGGTCNIPYSKVPCTTCKPHALVLSMTHTYEHETLRAICVCAYESQRAVASDGRTVQITDSVTIEIAKGARDGMTLQFKHRGNEYPGTVTCTYLPSYLPTFICLARFAFSASSHSNPSDTADVIILIREKPHTRFVRQGDDLLYTATVSLLQALCGFALEIVRCCHSFVLVARACVH